MFRSLARHPRVCNVRQYVRRTLPLSLPIETVQVDYFPPGETQARWLRPPETNKLVQKGSVLGTLETAESKVVLDVVAPVSGMIVQTTMDKDVVMTMDDVVASIDTDESDNAWLHRHLQSSDGKLDADFLAELVNRDNNFERILALAVTLRENFPQYHATALELFQRVREGHEGNPLRQATVDVDTGLLYQTIGDLDAALQYFQRAVDSRKQQVANTTLSEDEVEEPCMEEDRKSKLQLIEDMIHLARIRHIRGELKEAQAVLEHCLQLQSKVLGRDHTAVADTYFNLGAIAWEEGSTSNSRQHYAMALDGYEERWPDGHEDSANAHHMLAVISHHDGDWENTLKHAESVIAIRKVVKGERHPDTASAHQFLGDMLAEMEVGGMAERAINELQTAYDIQQEHFGEVHEVPAETITKVGAACCLAKQYDKALQHFHTGVEINEKLANKSMTASLFSNIGIVHTEKGQLDVAQVYNQKAYKLIEELNTEAKKQGTPLAAEQTAAILADMGNVFKRQHRFHEALVEYERAHALLASAFGPIHPDVVSSWSSQGELHAIQGDYDTALEHYNNALQTMKSLLGDEENHPQVAACLYNIGMIQKKRGDPMTAKTTLEKARDVWSRTLGAAHPQTVAVEELIASLPC